MFGWRMATAVAVLGIATALPVRAADPLIAVGASMTTGSRFAPALALDVAGDVHDLGSWHWQPLVGVTAINRRSDRADDLNHRVAVAAFGARLTDLPHHLYFSFQFGLAAGRTDAISSGEQFVSTLGWQHQDFVLQVRHISNGKFFRGRNLGETMLMAGWQF